ncbi:putative cyclin-dependent kinase F-2 [Panicum virgatum]|uniref:putative cyclin-dependent kinase F-2 n=1 Tax=Panicum virgatum TaxID=38727 RepID=UPI0019D6848E|nr:putative cyclin-dependent kinase F-2 [Panicum virgatum]
MVAVKWIRGGEFDGAGAPNLPAVVREAGCVAACRCHPGIVQIKNVDKSEETGDLYIVMELAGPSLRSRLEGQPFSEDETRDSMRQLLQAVEKLHATGTIHRDINPDNILVGTDETLKICGFGCATPARHIGKMFLEKLVSAMMQSPEKLDGTTMQYRPSEQLIFSQYYGPEGDIYALGCVIFELLTGEPLFTATTEDDMMIEQTLELSDELRKTHIHPWP